MTYGEKITSDERFNRTGLDLLARMIYVEAEGESEMGKRAVACVARNRKDHKKASKFGGTTYGCTRGSPPVTIFFRRYS